MPIVFLFLFFLSSVVPGQSPASTDNAPATVLEFKWFKDKQSSDKAVNAGTNAPAPAMISANKNFERQRRINDPAGVMDPNSNTIDGRSAELDRIVQESREAKPRVDGFTYQAKIQNTGAKVIKTVFWEFRFTESANPSNVSRRQFVCSSKVKPDKTKDLEVFSLTSPSGVVSVGSLAKKTESIFQEAVLVNRIEYEDGSFWQRKDWNFDEVRLAPKPRDSRTLPVCRSL